MMKRQILLLLAFVLVISCQTFAAIVYSGSQNVTLSLGPMQTMSTMTFNIAGMDTERWDDFRIELWWYQMNMVMGTHLMIYAPMSMTSMSGIVGFTDMTSGLPVALNLAFGDEIGQKSSFVGYANLYDSGVGQFGEEGGYIGLMMDIPGSSLHYAWLQVSGMSNPGTINHSLTISGWAYEDQPGVSIDAGAIPVPAAIGLGGVGIALVAWLRRRKAV
jgi:hypothetical protein